MQNFESKADLWWFIWVLFPENDIEVESSALVGCQLGTDDRRGPFKQIRALWAGGTSCGRVQIDLGYLFLKSAGKNRTQVRLDQNRLKTADEQQKTCEDKMHFNIRNEFTNVS
jgi:hypothetical protein